MRPIENEENEENDDLLNITICWSEEFIKQIENTDLIIELVNIYECYVTLFIKEAKIWFVDIDDMPIDVFDDLLREIKLISMPCEIKIKM